MTLGGLAIAVGELVDDAVVDVENILRVACARTVSATPLAHAGGGAPRQRRGALGHRGGHDGGGSGVRAALCAAGHRGAALHAAGVAYIVSILASMLVSMTVTPALAAWLLPKMRRLDRGDSALVQRLEAVGRAPAALVLQSTPRCWPARPRRRCWWRRARWRHCRAPSCRPSTRARWWWAS